jgi:hypothetical protein
VGIEPTTSTTLLECLEAPEPLDYRGLGSWVSWNLELGELVLELAELVLELAKLVLDLGELVLGLIFPFLNGG